MRSAEIPLFLVAEVPQVVAEEKHHLQLLSKYIQGFEKGKNCAILLYLKTVGVYCFVIDLANLVL